MSTHCTVWTVASPLAARQDLRVVALGVHEEGLNVVACAEAGVYGYVSRDAGFEDVASALRSGGMLVLSARPPAKAANADLDVRP